LPRACPHHRVLNYVAMIHLRILVSPTGHASGALLVRAYLLLGAYAALKFRARGEWRVTSSTFRSLRRTSVSRSGSASCHRTPQVRSASTMPDPLPLPQGCGSAVQRRYHDKIDVRSFGGWMVARKATMDSHFAYWYRLWKSSRAGSGPRRFRIFRCSSRAASSTADQPMKGSSFPQDSEEP
jgi:hypothetical protein